MRILCCVLLAATAAKASSDDLTIVSKHSTNGQPGEVTTSYLGSDHVRMASGGGRETIIDLKSGIVTNLDLNKKTYYQVTKEEMDELAAKAQERLNSPEQQKRMEAMQGMTANAANSIEVKKTGNTRKIAGYKCEEWLVTAGKVSTNRECVTTELKFPEHAFDAYKAYTQKLASSMSAMQPARIGESMVDKMKVIKGYPVATSITVDFMGNKRISESEVVEVKRGSIPASAWEVPAGYAKIDNPVTRAFGNRGH
jgi:Domain of unknown function (DUF4412)